jgi:hypothetical protein
MSRWGAAPSRNENDDLPLFGSSKRPMDTTPACNIPYEVEEKFVMRAAGDGIAVVGVAANKQATGAGLSTKNMLWYPHAEDIKEVQEELLATQHICLQDSFN